jgi:hypothetical protein
MTNNFKHFIFNLLKSLNPKYYRELAEKDISNAFLYFFILIGIAFLLMSIISVPKLLFLKADLNQAFLDVTSLHINADFQTAKPISLPKDKPVISFDTTNNKTLEKEAILVTDKSMYYNLFGKKTEIPIGSYEMGTNRQQPSEFIIGILLFILPSIFAFYYIIYALKYSVLIIVLALASYVIAKVTKNKSTLKEAIVLSVYTSTAMILLEILSLPFFITDYILVYSPFVGVNFSLIAITIYLVLYATAIRLNGNPDLI